MTCQIVRAKGYEATVIKYMKATSSETFQINISGILKCHSRQCKAVGADTLEEAIKGIKAEFGSCRIRFSDIFSF